MKLGQPQSFLFSKYLFDVAGSNGLLSLSRGASASGRFGLRGSSFSLRSLLSHLLYVPPPNFFGTDIVEIQAYKVGSLRKPSTAKLHFHVKEDRRVPLLSASLPHGYTVGTVANLSLDFLVNEWHHESDLLCLAVDASQGRVAFLDHFVAHSNTTLTIWEGDPLGAPFLRFAGRQSDVLKASKNFKFWINSKKYDFPELVHASQNSIGIANIKFLATNSLKDCGQLVPVSGTVKSAVNGSSLAGVYVEVSQGGSSVAFGNFSGDVFKWQSDSNGHFAFVADRRVGVNVYAKHRQFAEFSSFVPAVEISSRRSIHIFMLDRILHRAFTWQMSLHHFPFDDVQLHAVTPFSCHLHFGHRECSYGNHLDFLEARWISNFRDEDSVIVHGSPKCIASETPLRSCQVFVFVDIRFPVHAAKNISLSLFNSTLPGDDFFFVFNRSSLSSTQDRVLWLALTFDVNSGRFPGC